MFPSKQRALLLRGRIMKKILVLTAAVLTTGCATPHEKAEKLAHKIEKESLSEPEGAAARPVPADPQPEHALRFAAKAGMTPVVLLARAARDFARALPDLVFAPVHVAGLPFQIVRDTAAFCGEIGKAVFPPPRPKVK